MVHQQALVGMVLFKVDTRPYHLVGGTETAGCF